VFYRFGYDDAWEKIATGAAMKQVSVDGESVWGISTTDGIYKRANSGKWNKVPGSLKQISTSMNSAVGVNKYDDIFTAIPSGTSVSWKQVPGKLKQVAVSGSEVWGVNKKDQIYYRSLAKGSWVMVPGKLKQVSVSGLHVWGVDVKNQVYYRYGTTGKWKLIPGTMALISVSEKGVATQQAVPAWQDDDTYDDATTTEPLPATVPVVPNTTVTSSSGLSLAARIKLAEAQLKSKEGVERNEKLKFKADFGSTEIAAQSDLEAATQHVEDEEEADVLAEY